MIEENLFNYIPLIIGINILFTYLEEHIKLSGGNFLTNEEGISSSFVVVDKNIITGKDDYSFNEVIKKLINIIKD